MRVFLAAAAAALATVLIACGGSSYSSTPTLGATRPAASAVATRVATPSTAPTLTTPATAGAEVEVTGIVGTVSTATRLIEIDRLSGAPIRRISVDGSTVYRRAGGGSTTLAQIRSSQRIIAQGTINDRGDTLLATEITVQDVIQGGAPGG
jgi:hypothetical protein